MPTGRAVYLIVPAELDAIVAVVALPIGLPHMVPDLRRERELIVEPVDRNRILV